MMPRALTEAEARYIRKAFRLRRKLSNKALSAKFGVGENAVIAYGHKRHKDMNRGT